MHDRESMKDKVINIENEQGPFQMAFERIWRMVPDRDKKDQNLKRLLAFRIRVDGEAATSEYLIRKIREVIQSSHKGPLYDFLHRTQPGLAAPDSGTDPPDVAELVPIHKWHLLAPGGVLAHFQSSK